ncbi:MAG: acyltransferase [Lachnospiraceae bacterium]|nr:acyltransferase [Lachnospiraceae bacterium]
MRRGIRNNIGANNAKVNIELLRIILTVAICLHHFRRYSEALPYGGGYLAVDYFFILSGFFMGKWLVRNRPLSWDTVVAYMKKRLGRLIPEYTFAFLSAFCLYVTVLNNRFEGNITGYITEALAIPFFQNASTLKVNPPGWYVGYLILASLIVLLFGKLTAIKSQYQPFAYIALAFTCLTLLWFSCGHLCIFPNEQTILDIATLIRSLAGLSLGVGIYELLGLKQYDTDVINCSSESNGEKSDNGSISRVDRYQKNAVIVAVFALIIVTSYCLFWYNGFSRFDYAVVILATILLILMEYAGDIIPGKRLKALIFRISSLSYSIYLYHYLVAFVFDKYRLMEGYDWKIVSIAYLGCVFAVSILLHAIYMLLWQCVKIWVKHNE